MAMITAEHVRFRYEEDNETPIVVLDDVDITVRKGEFVALLGHNGCGKSTLARHFNALLLPLGGRILVAGMDTADDDRRYEIRRTVGLVLQNPDNQLVSTIVEEDVAFGPENLGVPTAEIRRRVDTALKAVGMYDYRDHASHKLSGGQKQRVAIAGVLAMEPACLVLDEPTARIQHRGRREVMDTVCRLNRESGMTVVLITHYMEEAVLADRVLVMDDGRITMEGTPREVFSQVERLRELELDVPQATELCYRLKQEGISLPDGVLSVEECVQALLQQLS